MAVNPPMQISRYQVFLDESGSHAGAEALCVAAYLFEQEACAKLDAEWRTTLSDFDLPYFHMVDCVHRIDPFDRLNKEQAVEVEKRMISIIRTHMTLGTAVTVDEYEYNRWAARREVGTAYSYCCWMTVSMINAWMDVNGLDGELTYYFEAGHQSASQFNLIMSEVAGRSDVKRRYRHVSHSFVEKREVRPIQAPDILAWLHANHFKRLKRGLCEPRKDYVALVRDRPHKGFIATRESVSSNLVEGHPGLRGYRPSWIGRLV
jgi:hypothetical protein